MTGSSGAEERPFSYFWLVASVGVFVGLQLLLGGLVGQAVSGQAGAAPTQLWVQLLLNLGSYFLGGILVGMLSPGVRVVEPAVGAAFTLVVVLCVSFFMPHVFIRLSFTKLLFGAVLAFALALSGARIGERFMGNIRD